MGVASVCDSSPGDPALTSDLCMYQTETWWRDIHWEKHLYTENKNEGSKMLKVS